MASASRGRFRSAVALFLTVQRRSRFPHVYLGTALATVVLLRFALPPALAPQLVPVLVVGEVMTLSLYLVAAHRYLEQNERSVTALVVTPLRSGEYLGALVLASALIASGALIHGAVLGVDRGFALALPPIFASALVFGLLGVVVSACFDEFTRFILGSIPPFVVLGLPFLTYFGLLPRPATFWIPSDPALFALAASATPDAAGYLAGLALLALHTTAAFAAAHALFLRRVRPRLET